MGPIKYGPIVVATILLSVACGGEGTPTGMDDDDGGGEGGGVTRSIKADPSLASDIWEIFVRRGCTSAGCHGGAVSELTLSAVGNLHATLVNAASSGGEIYVIPGDADQSYLAKRLDGRVGPLMPLNGTSLDNIDLTNVRNWISAGASNN